VLLTFHHDRRNAIQAAAMRSTDEAFRPQVAGPNYLAPMILVPSILVPSEDQEGTGDHVMSISGISLIRADRLAEPCSGPSIMLRTVM
jgi:hypothetical protein